MLKETITYTDYNDVERTEDFWFNLSKAEIIEMEMGTAGGFVEMVQRVVAAEDTPTIMKIFKDFILKSIGVKSPDGKRFIKNEEISTSFYQSEAYSVLLTKICSNADYAAKFVNGIIPSAPASTPANN